MKKRAIKCSAIKKSQTDKEKYLYLIEYIDEKGQHKQTKEYGKGMADALRKAGWRLEEGRLKEMFLLQAIFVVTMILLISSAAYVISAF